jgi:hypothetical protein
MHLEDSFTTDQYYLAPPADPLLAFRPSEELSPRVLALHFSKASFPGLSHNHESLHSYDGSPKFQRTRRLVHLSRDPPSSLRFLPCLP